MQSLNPQLHKAIQLHQKGKYRDAELAYREILKESDTDASIYNNLVDTMNRQGKQKESVVLLEYAIEKYPNYPELKVSLGQSLMNLGELEEAKEVLLSLSAENPKMAEVHYVLGNLYLHQGQTDAALQAFEKAVFCKAELAEAHYNIGVLRYQKGERDRARSKWRAALKYQPDLIPALLNLGNLELENSHYQEAVQYLDQLLQYDHNHPAANKLIGMAKHTLGEVEDALKHYELLHQLQGPTDEILTLLANANRDLNRSSEAEKFYQEALKLNPEHEIAKQNLEKIRSGKIESWQFEMLGDLKRNDGYDEVIKRLVKKGETVLDIGTGSGILSMMCTRAGAKMVYTCESVKDIAEAAEEVIEDNGFGAQIQVFNLRSTALKIGKHIPQKVDVLVSEVLDAGLIGEGVIPTLRHAKENLLKKGGVIIPKSAMVKGVLIQSDHIRSISPLEEISGFNLKSFAKFQQKNSYRPRQLKSIPHQVLSKEFDILPIDFYNLPNEATPENPNINEIEVAITLEGQVHALAFWFDLSLDDKLILSSGPDGEMIHWGQAIFAFPEVKNVRKGDKLKITVEQSESVIKFK